MFTAVVSSGGTWDEVYDQASKDLSKVQSWMDSKTLSLNINKTKYLPMFLLNEDDPGNRVLRAASLRVDMVLLSGWTNINS